MCSSSICFYFAFPKWLTCHSVSSIVKCLFTLLHTFTGFVFHCGILTVWDRNPLSDIWYTNIFSRSIICLFTVLTVSFKELKFLNFDEVQFIKCLRVMYLVLHLRNTCLTKGHRYYLFSSVSFVVSRFTCRSKFHSELIL